ncbi:TIGR03084 family metal-binding protein [Tenggerimyces flavus]|uniref:TIGR03084 family metal-binding protein n=1 Tax=Tenggerimyces flavus TaxID=1708749 RepID=A0ABV7YJS0_9ACTN|nr:TIGR03084 family metal-binding protein [Tenggerimyces flavus]MBM7789927.1 uncharacterized protein (TIGR03084 family) [Tenggerimyces flavus]
MVELAPVLADLADECADLDRLVADLPAASWDLPTPAPGWTIAHQIAHLAWTEEAAITAATAPDAFGERIREALDDFDRFVDRGAQAGATALPAEILERWRRSRSTLADALRATPPGTKLPWYGVPIGAVSMASARIMETWAHGLDVADALGMTREPTDRLRHVAHLAVRTRDFAFALRQLPAPTEEFRVALTAPDGSSEWTWGPEDADQQVTGPALDLCLLATQRRHRTDLALVAHGADADRWLDIAQTFAGPPGAGRPAGGAR